MSNEINKILASKEEGTVLYRALKEFMNGGFTEIDCPRCGCLLECRLGRSGSSIYCVKEGCIMASVRGI